MQRCLGIGRATGSAGGDIGGKVVGMVDLLTEMLLAKSVVGESHEINTDNINIFAAKVTGEKAKRRFDILDTGISVQFPQTFCIEKEENGVCTAPIGIAAASYKRNPRVKYKPLQLKLLSKGDLLKPGWCLSCFIFQGNCISPKCLASWKFQLWYLYNTYEQ